MTSNPKIITQKVTEGVIRTILGTLPCGPVFIEIFEIGGRIKQQRLNSFLEELAKFLTENQEDINIDNIRSEDFIDLFESVITRVVKTQSEIKRQRFKDILINKIKVPYYNIDNADIHLSLICELSEKAIEILSGHGVFNNKFEEEKQRKIDIEDQINKTTLEVQQEWKNNRSGHANRYSSVNSEKQKLETQLRELEQYFSSLEKYRTAEHYNITETEFLYYKQSLASKALLIDSGVGSIGCRSFEIMSITQFGQDFINFILKK